MQDRVEEWCTAIWKHTCGHFCEWQVPVPDSSYSMNMKLRYAKNITKSFSHFPCPWCGAGTGTFHIPKDTTRFAFKNFRVPLVVQKVRVKAKRTSAL